MNIVKRSTRLAWCKLWFTKWWSCLIDACQEWYVSDLCINENTNPHKILIVDIMPLMNKITRSMHNGQPRFICYQNHKSLVTFSSVVSNNENENMILTIRLVTIKICGSDEKEKCPNSTINYPETKIKILRSISSTGWCPIHCESHCLDQFNWVICIHTHQVLCTFRHMHWWRFSSKLMMHILNIIYLLEKKIRDPPDPTNSFPSNLLSFDFVPQNIKREEK